LIKKGLVLMIAPKREKKMKLSLFFGLWVLFVAAISRGIGIITTAAGLGTGLLQLSSPVMLVAPNLRGRELAVADKPSAWLHIMGLEVAKKALLPTSSNPRVSTHFNPNSDVSILAALDASRNIIALNNPKNYNKQKEDDNVIIIGLL
jgi:hypothetical protein